MSNGQQLGSSDAFDISAMAVEVGEELKSDSVITRAIKKESFF
jgi:hypothetical protein